MLTVTFEAPASTNLNCYPWGYVIPTTGTATDLVLGSIVLGRVIAKTGTISVYNYISASTGKLVRGAAEGISGGLTEGGAMSAVNAPMHPFRDTNVIPAAFVDANRVLELETTPDGAAYLCHRHLSGAFIAWRGATSGDVLTVEFDPQVSGKDRYRNFLQGFMRITDGAAQAITVMAFGTPTRLTVGSALEYPKNKRVAVDITGNAVIPDGRYSATVKSSVLIDVDVTTGSNSATGTVKPLANAVAGSRAAQLPL